MKVTFTPIDPKPVRTADMPDGVAYETEANDGSTIVRINKDNYVWTVDAEGKPLYRMFQVGPKQERRVLRRRDGQPLPGGEPVPLDVLEPLPMWYRSADEDGYFSHDGKNGYTFVGDDGAKEMQSNDASFEEVHPQPYIMEVQR